MEHPLRASAMFVRDLLDYDESLMAIGRLGETQDNYSAGYIVVDSLLAGSPSAFGKEFDGTNEQMTVSVTETITVTVDFLGDAAYTNANDFAMLMLTEKRNEIQVRHGISVFNVTGITDVKRLAGSLYTNRLQVEFVMMYNRASTLGVKRIDTAQLLINSEV